jgi:hypothetical protein
MVADTLNTLWERGYADKKQLLPHIVRVLRLARDNVDPQAQQRLEALKNQMTGSSFRDRLRRYVALRIHDEEYDDEGKKDDTVSQQMALLAEQSVRTSSLLEPEITWLVTEEAQNAYPFGYELGKRDAPLAFVTVIVRALETCTRNRSTLLLGGYLRALAELALDRWELTLDELAQNPKLARLVPDLTWRSRLTDRAAKRITNLLDNGVIDSSALWHFAWTCDFQLVSENRAEEWFRVVLSCKHNKAAYVLLDLLHSYYLHSDETRKLPSEIVCAALTHRTFFGAYQRQEMPQAGDYNWTELATALLKQEPVLGIKLAKIMVQYFGDDRSILGTFYSRTHGVLSIICTEYPEEVWKLITEAIGPPINSRAFHLTHWLQGERGFRDNVEPAPLDYVPRELVWNWVDGHVDDRAGYLASFVPPRLVSTQGIPSLARELLVRYGAREDVQGSLFANFLSGAWSGPEHLYLQRRREELTELRGQESDKNVCRWLDDFIAYLTARIGEATVRDEREHMD